MNRIKKIKIFALTLFLAFPFFSHGQEDDAAAASSTGSAAAPAKGAPKSAQANAKLRTLHIAIHKLGLTADQILSLGSLDKLHEKYKDALKGGGFKAFTKHGKNMVKHDATFDQAKTHGDLLDIGISLQDAIDHGDLLRQDHSLEDAKLYGDLLKLGITAEQWNLYKDQILATGLTLEQLIQHFGDSGATLEQILAYADLLIKGHTFEDAKLYADFLRDPSLDGLSLNEALDLAKTLDKESKMYSADIFAAKNMIISKYVSGFDYNEGLTSALSVATNLLQDKTITSTLPATSITVSSLTDGYNLELIRLLSAYGAIGGNGESLATAVLGTDYSGYAKGGTLSSLIQNSSSDYLSFLSTLTGSRGFADEDASSSVLDVSLDKITLIPGSTITLGSSGADSTIDVSSKLSPASSKSDRKILILGAAKDLTVAGNVKLTNPNDAEDHALVLGAADDVMVDGANIEYTGSNLAIGAGGSDADSMYLVNTSITTGGNLAAGSLGNLNISSAKFSVGMANSASSDPDNIYLYANEILSIDNLAFSGRVDDIYMESKTIHIKNTTFPATSDVMLRSLSGVLNIDNSNAPTMAGAVNFHNVTHLGISNSALTLDQFNGGPGHVNSLATLPNGTPFIKVRAQ